MVDFPHVIGVVHHVYYAEQVIDYILKKGYRRVGIELAPLHLRDMQFYDEGTRYFWGRLRAKLDLRGVEVIPLVPNSLALRLFEQQLKGHLTAIDIELPGRAKNPIYYWMVHHTLTRALEKKAIQLKPDAIVVGALHAYVIRKDQRLPGSHFHSIGVPSGTVRELEQLVSDISRFRKARVKGRKSRIRGSRPKRGFFR